MRVTVPEETLRRTFAAVADSPAFAESAALVAAGGKPVEMLQAMSLRPEILATFASTGGSIYPGGILDRRIKELVIVQSSRRNACQFCTQSHLAIVRGLGWGDAFALLDQPGALTERERLAVEYTRLAQADSNRIPEEFFAKLRAAFTDPEVVELTALIGLITMLNLFNNCLQVTYRGEYGS